MIHPSAIVDSKAELAEDITIGAYSIVGPGVVLGAGSWLAPHVVLRGPAVFGRGTKIYSFACLGDAPQDLKYAGAATRLEVGDNNVFREYATANRGTEEGGGVTRIGDDNLFMAYTHVAHDCQVGNKVIFSNAASLAGHVSVGDHAILGGFTTVHQFSCLGEHCFTGLSTVVNRDIPPYVAAAGNHAKAYGINKEGLNRRGFSKQTIAALHTAYRLLIKSKTSREQALKQVDSLRVQYPEVNRFVEFILASRRGVVR